MLICQVDKFQKVCSHLFFKEEPLFLQNLNQFSQILPHFFWHSQNLKFGNFISKFNFHNIACLYIKTWFDYFSDSPKFFRYLLPHWQRFFVLSHDLLLKIYLISWFSPFPELVLL